MTSDAITTWLRPLQAILDPAARLDWRRLKALDTALDAVLTMHPVGADRPAGAERSHRLRIIRRELARLPPVPTPYRDQMGHGWSVVARGGSAG